MNTLKINKNLLYIMLLTIVTLISFFVMYGKLGCFIIDCGREAFFPMQINEGGVLYKNMINIYGPFSYMFNALLYKLMGTNLNTLYIAGLIAGYTIIISVYTLARNFISENVGFILGLLTVAVGIFSTNVFNFIFPYSYGMLYGTAFCLLSLIFLFEKNKYSSILAALFAGLAITNKYEFVLYAPIFFIALFKLYKPKKKEFVLNIISFLAAPVVCFGILFLNGLTFEDISRSLKIVKYISQATTLHYFYSKAGLIYRNEHFIVWGKQLLNCCLAFFLLVSGFNTKRKVIKLILFVFAIIYLALVMNCFIFSFIPILTLILFLFEYKKLSIEAKIYIFSIFAISIKTFLGLSYQGYGVYYFTPVILSLLLLVPKKNIRECSVFLLITAIVVWFANYKGNIKTYPIQTTKGTIFVEKPYGETYEQLINHINKKVKKDEKVVIYPEGQLINFITDKQSDNLIYSLIPLYIETFGEKNIVHRFSVIKPEYVIINNWNTSDYKYKELFGDYGFKILDYIKSNYKIDGTYGKFLKFTIYKRNDL